MNHIVFSAIRVHLVKQLKEYMNRAGEAVGDEKRPSKPVIETLSLVITLNIRRAIVFFQSFRCSEIIR